MRNITEFTYGISDYDRYWERRRATEDFNETGIHRYIVDLVTRTIPPGGKVLDCGVGPAVYHQQLASSYEMHGIEISPEAIKLYPFDTSRIVSFDLNNGLPAYDVLFDGMIASMIVHHLDDPMVFLRAARSRLALGGHLILSHPNLVFYKHRLRLLAGRFPKLSTSHRNFIVPSTLAKMLEDAGFKTESMSGRKRRPLPTLLAHEVFFICSAR